MSGPVKKGALFLLGALVYCILFWLGVWIDGLYLEHVQGVEKCTAD